MSDSSTSSMTRVTQLGYLRFEVSDLAAWREFATEVLGCQVVYTSEAGGLLLRIDDYRYRFIITEGPEDDAIGAGWEVKDADALAAVAEQLLAAGFKVESGSESDLQSRMVLGMIKCQDPSGLATEIYYGPQLDHRPFTSPRGVSGFNAGPLGLGHMVLSVDDGPAMVRFYTEVLGARISDYIHLTRGPMNVKLTFLHVNPRHHSLAIVQRPPAGSATHGPRKRIQHFMLELNSIDDVGYALELCQQRGFNPAQLGKHTNDHMLSFYVNTPSGFSVEYGFNGRTIDDERNWEIQHYRASSFWGHGMPPPKPSAANELPAAPATAQ